MHHDKEAVILCRYLTGEDPVQTVIAEYNHAVQQSAISLTATQQNTWSRCLHHPTLLPYVDAAWSWNNPIHPLRHRIFIMLSTLEAHRKYQHYFLPVARTSSYKLIIALRLTRSAFRLLAGKVLLCFL